MKRSFEDTEIERNVKQVKTVSFEENDSSEISSSEISSSEISSSTSSEKSSLESSSDVGNFNEPIEQEQEEQEAFVPTIVEKQIIRQALAMICRSNMSDWSTEVEKSAMILRELTVVVENTVGICCDIILDISFTPLQTYCRILYSLDKEEDRKSIYMCWETEYMGDYNSFDKIIISKYVDKTVYVFFTKSVRQMSEFYPRDCEEDSWCFFSDARNHLQRIAL